MDHSIERWEKGAAGQLIVEGPDRPDILQVVQMGTGGGGGHQHARLEERLGIVNRKRP